MNRLYRAGLVGYGLSLAIYASGLAYLGTNLTRVMLEEDSSQRKEIVEDIFHGGKLFGLAALATLASSSNLMALDSIRRESLEGESQDG